MTRLDHDANISPWLLIAEDRGCKVTWVDFDVEDGTLKVDDFARALERGQRSWPSAMPPMRWARSIRRASSCRWPSEAGALVYVDAVQYAPHGPIDVQDLGCDFLVCSSYKFFGPHAGILYGRLDLLNELKAYKVRPASDAAAKQVRDRARRTTRVSPESWAR